MRWSHPHGRKITLAVIRHLASQPERRIGSLFWNPGGPGGSLDRVKNDGERLDVILQGRFDIVGWDLRGTGESMRVRCFRSEELAQRFFHDWALPFTTASSRRTVRKVAALARRCRALSGDLLAHISTSDTVRDLDHLRRLVGDPQLSYWGWSPRSRSFRWFRVRRRGTWWRHTSISDESSGHPSVSARDRPPPGERRRRDQRAPR